MLFRRRSLDGIRAGEITLAFRRWDRPRARAGGRQRTIVGELAIDSVEPVERADITVADAARAGHASLDELFAELDKRGDAQIWRIEMHRAGEDRAARCASRPTLIAASWSGCASGYDAWTAPAGTGRGRARRWN